MEIREVTSDKRQYMDLLLLGDEQESMINKYLERGRMYVLEDGICRAVCVVTDEGSGILEMKNLAVAPEVQKKGYGRAMIEYIIEVYKASHAVLQAGTGESPMTVPFYEKCGFYYSHRVKNFFTENYDHPIYEDGILLTDMIYYRRHMKPLSEMKPEELWQIFPIQLMAHQKFWKDWYEEEAEKLREIWPNEGVFYIHHIGSTSVEGIWAKPIIDILVETGEDSRWDRIEKILSQNGYQKMSESENRISFNKGYTEKGFAERVYHLHLRRIGDNEEVYFRDYLRAHPETAREYEKLKLNLWKKFEYNRDAYTNSKTDFITKYRRMQP